MPRLVRGFLLLFYFNKLRVINRQLVFRLLRWGYRILGLDKVFHILRARPANYGDSLLCSEGRCDGENSGSTRFQIDGLKARANPWLWVRP